MTNLEKVGIIGGQAIYADTGTDQIKILQDEVKRRVEAKKLKPGDGFYMEVDFGQRLVIKVNVEESPKL